MTSEDLGAESILFGLLDSESILQLSVVKITNAQSFDSLGHPLKGALYDPAMGPRERELCGTCSTTLLLCPGHFGHIELPLQVVNPLFFKAIFNILKCSCLHCYRMQVSHRTLELLTLQLNLLDGGHITAALDLDNFVSEVDDLAKDSSDSISFDIFENEIVKGFLQLWDTNSNKEQIFLNKNRDKLRNTFLMNVIKKASSVKSCKFCSKPIIRVTTLDNKMMCNMPTANGKKHKIMMPDEICTILTNIWNTENSLIKQILPVLKSSKSKCPMSNLFCEHILVLPPLVRPCNIFRGQLIDHPQTMVYKAVLNAAFAVRAVMKMIVLKKNSLEKDEKVIPEVLQAYNLAQGKDPLEKLHYTWQDLQKAINNLLSCSSDIAAGQGLKQIIEKKLGVIRMHMMGKRVNFAARSVITPDPNVDVNEIGIPEAFALKLTYPVAVTPFNADELRQMVINGPNVHPGAVTVQSTNGRIIRIPPDNLSMRKSLAKRLLTPDESKRVCSKVVHRHLINGDVLLLNRQPTLHKPSIMAHKARVLKGEKTLRMHYANCKSYNADFDGDEMNAHFPQNELARSEAYNIMIVDKQYLVPKDGTPLSGLIQDHIISGVKITMRGKFFSQFDYRQLVYQAFGHRNINIKLLPPSIIKPVRLWSGKQVISTVILNCIPSLKHPITLFSKAKIPSKEWVTQPARTWQAGGTPFLESNAMSESEVIIRKGELLCGVLDKTHYGSTPYGLIHCIYELYGGEVSSAMLTAFSRVFTLFLQWEGFTLGVEDILIRSRANKKRLHFINSVRDSGDGAALTAVDLPPDYNTSDLHEILEDSYSNNPKFRTAIDRKYKSILDQYTNDINKCCLPRGLIKKFPHNNLQLMVQSGAKGSTVNTMQISCLLGQIELEGKRPPLMISGKSLPSFLPYETCPRAGGFIDGRFMTGIQPQEFFYHCMAGREGLIDTAVKTSRSGYLQRCLIKHLEGISVQYDMTVRDSDNSIIQFFYGEDGMDVCKSQFLKKEQFDFLNDNQNAILDETVIEALLETTQSKAMDVHRKKLKKWSKKNQHISDKIRLSSFSKYCQEESNNKKLNKSLNLSELTSSLRKSWLKLDPLQRAEFYEKPCPDPLISLFKPDKQFGAINEKLDNLIKSYIKSTCLVGVAGGDCNFSNVVKLKSMNALVAPGEAVGLLAAQSIGEPSTQMTLNTFHFAGRGDMNVTLGIPRLREILMMASMKPKTPSMDIPFLDNIPDINRNAENLRQKLTRVTVAEVLERIQVDSALKISSREFICELTFIFLPKSICKSQFLLKPRQILKHIEETYFSEMFMAIKKITKTSCGIVWTTEHTRQARNTSTKADDVSSDEETADQDDDTTQVRSRLKHEEQEYEDPESEEEEKSDDELDQPQNMDVEDEGFGEGSDDSHSVSVINAHSKVTNYQYDKTHGRWCKLVVTLPASFVKVDLSAVLKETASKSNIRDVQNIKRAITFMNNNQLTLKTDGINILQMFNYSKLLNLNKLYCNDIHGVAKTYGIEAAVKVIVREIQGVFDVYGINVDVRHLSLIADYMTYNGIFEPMSRKGMESSVSPLQQMSFESSLTFLKEATISAKTDSLSSASARLMLGKPCRTGTGAFSVYLDSNLSHAKLTAINK